MNFEKIYDISVALGTESVDFPGDPSYSLEPVRSLARDDPYTIHKLTLSTHTGTHLDLPAHFIPRERDQTIEQFPVKAFIFPAQVLEVPSEKDAIVSLIESIRITPGTALLFKTGNSRTGIATKGVVTETAVTLSLKAAEICAKKRISLVGWDYATIEFSPDETYPVHWALLENHILLLEGITLAHVPAGNYTLFCLPLKIPGAEASPTRAILVQ
jgi:arylformamidase